MGGAKNTTMLTLTNDHLCSHTDGGKSTYVFHTGAAIVIPPFELEGDPKPLERQADEIKLDRE